MACFEDLDDGVLYMVFQYLRSERRPMLRLFRCVSKRLKSYAESVLYRHIVLEEDTVEHERASYRFIERLLNKTDVLSRHVRSLQIKEFRGDDVSSCMNTELLVACVHTIEKLESLSWNSGVPMPDSLLIALHQRHPCAKLSVSLRTFNQAILSSTQLNQLSVSIPCSVIVQDETISALEQVKRVIQGCHGLRTLSIDVHQLPNLQKPAQTMTKNSLRSYTSGRVETQRQDYCIPGCAPQRTEAMNKFQMVLERTARFPPLEELSLRARTYSLDETHCLRLRECMDWSKLKRLVLGPPNPVAFLETFTHELPVLEHLDISLHWSVGMRSYNIEPYDHKAYSRFICSLKKLRSIVVRCNVIDSLSEGLWSTLVNTHGKILQSISMQPLHEGLEAPILHGPLNAFATALTGLRTLDLALNTQALSWRGCDDCSGRRHILSTDYAIHIPLIASLYTLSVSVGVAPSDEKSLYSSIVDHAHCAIWKLWAAYADALNEYDLEVFNLRFWRWEGQSLHLDNEQGGKRGPRITSLVFESRRSDGQLIVRVRNAGEVIETRYNEVWCDGLGSVLRTTYVPGAIGCQDAARESTTLRPHVHRPFRVPTTHLNNDS